MGVGFHKQPFARVTFSARSGLIIDGRADDG